MSNDLLSTTLEKEKKIRKKKVKKDKDSIKDFSWVLFFAGEEFNQELTQNQETKDNTIDFDQLVSDQGEIVEKKIREICDSAKNKQLTDNGEYPIIWFKNIEKIKSNSPLEKSLLPVFDPQQNTELFSDKIDLSKFILVATSSTNNMGKLSSPLTSRLDCINVSSAKPKEFFFNKHFNWVLTGSIILICLLSLLIFWPSEKKIKEE